MAKYTANYELGDLVTGRTGRSITMRVVEIIDAYAVKVVPASAAHGTQGTTKNISELRNMTKGDPL